MKSSQILTTSLLVLHTLLLAAGASAKPVAQQGRSCHLPGSEEALRCIDVPLPLDYSKPNAASLKVHVTVAPAFRESARPDPLFVLAGGPGQAGTDVLVVLNSMFRRVRATRDIVFIDQRGTGLSGKLDCPDVPHDESMTDEENEAAARACVASVKQPFSAYSTANAARDIEGVRQALGYGNVNVWGASYGTRLAQHYARDFPTNVRSLVLDGVVPTDQAVPAAGLDGQAALDLVFRQCANDKACHKAYPDLRAQYAALVERVAAPGGIKLTVPDPRTARPLKIDMNSDRFLGTVHNILYSPLDTRRLPFLIHSAYEGRWEPFIARRNAAGDFSPDGPVAQLLHLAIICSEDMPMMTPALMAADASPLTAPMLKRYTTLCALMPKSAPVALKAPSMIAAPVLMLSGMLDPITPPRRAVAAGKFMRSAQHLVVANAGHGVASLGCAPRLLREFIDKPGNKVNAGCLKEIPAPTFQLGNAGPQP